MAEGCNFDVKISQVIPGAPNATLDSLAFLRYFLGLNWVAYTYENKLVISAFSYLSDTRDHSILQPYQTILPLGGPNSRLASCVQWVKHGKYKGNLACLYGSNVQIFEPRSQNANSTFSGGPKLSKPFFRIFQIQMTKGRNVVFERRLI